MALPSLREELSLMPGPVLADGQRSHMLHDPVRNLFFQIDWPTFEMMRRWRLGNAAAIAAAVSSQTTLQLEPHDVEATLDFFRTNELLQQGAGGAAALAAERQRRQGGLWQWLLHNYL